ncbi:MAG: hypothetical protein BMS9Abin11_1331 [Gammaproteobacteria bacterium]|nr:MAG: hypothetical protein BMS9Abin11_1331 [Gammaproteobacteria bacterium]
MRTLIPIIFERPQTSIPSVAVDLIRHDLMVIYFSRKLPFVPNIPHINGI